MLVFSNEHISQLRARPTQTLSHVSIGQFASNFGYGFFMPILTDTCAEAVRKRRDSFKQIRCTWSGDDMYNKRPPKLQSEYLDLLFSSMLSLDDYATLPSSLE